MQGLNPGPPDLEFEVSNHSATHASTEGKQKIVSS